MSFSKTAARRLVLALLLALGVSASACNGEMVPLGSSGPASSGDDDSPPPPAPDAAVGQPPPPANAEADFNSNVKPILTSCIGCHGGTAAPLGFLGTAATMYATITASDIISKTAPASSTLLTHTHASGGIEFTSAQKTTVQTWLTEYASQ